jgi:osmotically-inducible protein OsmY
MKQVKRMLTRDEHIKRQVLEQITWDNSLDSSTIEVEVKNDRVILKGTVPSVLAKRAAERDVTKLHSVTAIENQLTVKPPPDSPPINDEEILAAIKNLMGCSVDVKAADIRVQVKNGMVSLTGTVDSYWKKARLEDLVSSVNGVLEVRDRTSVVPAKNALDMSIEREIIKALQRMEYVTTDDIKVTVKNGVVTLTGSVSTWDLSFDIEDTARYTTGVTGVKNNLSVK